jgi:hypothetical protein
MQTCGIGPHGLEGPLRLHSSHPPGWAWAWARVWSAARVEMECNAGVRTRVWALALPCMFCLWVILQWTFSKKNCANLQTSYKDNYMLFINSFSHGFHMGLALSEPRLNPARAVRSCIFPWSDFIGNERTASAWRDDERKEAVASLSTRRIDVRCQDAVALPNQIPSPGTGRLIITYSAIVQILYRWHTGEKSRRQFICFTHCIFINCLANTLMHYIRGSSRTWLNGAIPVGSIWRELLWDLCKHFMRSVRAKLFVHCYPFLLHLVF